MRDRDGLLCCTDSANCIFPQLSCSSSVKKIRNFLAWQCSVGNAFVLPAAPGAACPREGSLDTPGLPAFSLRRTCPQTPHLLSPSFSPLFFFFLMLGGVLEAFFFCLPPTPRRESSRECRVGEVMSPATESRASWRRRRSPRAFLQQCRTAHPSSQHSFSLTTLPSFILSSHGDCWGCFQ